MKPYFPAIIIAVSLLLSCSNKAPVSSVSTPAGAETPQSKVNIKITGAGSVYPAIKILAEAYQAKNNQVKIEFLQKTQSSGGIASVKNELSDIGLTTRPLKKDEDEGKIQYREVGKDALVVAVHSGVTGVKNLETKDLKAIYSGEVSNWQKLGPTEGEIVVLDRPEDESAKVLLRENYLGKDLKVSPKAVILKEEIELANNLQDTPDAIGTFSLGYSVISSLKVNHLSLDGIAPTTDNILNGKYKMVRTLGLVSAKTPPAATQGFIDFIFSSEGNKILFNSGFLPSQQPGLK